MLFPLWHILAPLNKLHDFQELRRDSKYFFRLELIFALTTIREDHIHCRAIVGKVIKQLKNILQGRIPPKSLLRSLGFCSSRD